jgi:hypothetical protein
VAAVKIIAMANFSELPLHDAILHSVTVSWKTRQCTLELEVFFERGANARPATLTFSNLSAVDLPHRAPWGESIFVNECSTDQADHYLIEMQTGDVLTFEASEFTLNERAST